MKSKALEKVLFILYNYNGDSMDIDMIKEVTIEYIENIYALSINYLKNNNNIKVKNLLEELELIEDRIRLCTNEKKLENYKNMLEILVKKIEGIINE